MSREGERGREPGRGSAAVSRDGGASRVEPGRSPRFVLDVYVEGEPVRRGAQVELHEDRLTVDGRDLPFEPIFWVSRRAGLLFLFARDFTAALKGRGQVLEQLARAAERRSDRGAQRRRLLQPFAGEVVVCTAGTAVAGTVAGQELRGLHLAVFTQRALHLLSRGRCHTLAWPVDRVQRARPVGGRPDQETLLLRKDSASIRLRYLFPEEIRAALRVAGRAPPPSDSPDGSLEMFARGEVARPVPARLPELTISVEVLQEASVVAAGRIPEALRRAAGVGPSFFELHFQELGEIALGPLMLRRSAVAGTEGLRRALQILDARGLREDTAAAVGAAGRRLAGAYAREAERLLGTRGRRGPLPRWGRDRNAFPLRLSREDQETLERRLGAPVDRLASSFARLEAAEEALARRLEAYEGGPPEGETAPVEEAAQEWRAALRRLDRECGTAWRELLEEVSGFWMRVLLPRLVRARTAPRRGAPQWLGAGAVALGILLAIVLLVRLF